MLNLITKEITPEDHALIYSRYPETMKGGLAENPYNESRIKPIYYEIPDGSKVLDVGANNGEFMLLLKEKKKCRVSGVDLSEVAVAQAKKKGLHVKLASAEDLPFKDKSFDFVTLNEVLAHVFNADKALKEIRRVLKKDGVLLGSTPHRNIEDALYDDKRHHRRYYDQASLILDLRKHFDRIFLKTLKGGQFSIGMATSHMADQDAEMLFKCGGKDTKDWEQELKNRSILRVWFGPTQPEGDVYYRMTGFIEKMRKGKGEFAYEPFDKPNEGPGSWQNKLLRNKENPDRVASPLALDHLEKCLRASDMSVWQITSTRDILAFLSCAKEVIKKPMVVEMDDWIFDLPGYNVASNPYKPNSDSEWTSYEQLKLADAFITSTEFIKQKLFEWFPKTPCYIIKNSIDFDVWDHLNPTTFLYPKAEGIIRIGYSGCGNHNEDIEIVKKPILALLEEFPYLEIVLPFSFQSWSDVQHPRVFFWNQWVPVKEFPNAIKGWEIDIGIAPLRDNTFNAAKSNLRWLEYSALKIPTVASPVEPFKCIEEGKTGFLADSKQDWYDKLKLLIVSKDLREKIGRLAYNQVKENFNMGNVSHEYLNILKEIKRGSIYSSR